MSRWNNLLNGNNDKQVWAAINWRGELNLSNPCENIRPSDEQFKDFFHSDEQISLEHISSDTHVPILDDPITVLEVNEQVKDLKSEKAAGVDGVPPGCPKTFASCLDIGHYVSHE